MGLGDAAAENLSMQDPTLERSFRGHRGAVHSTCFNPNMKQLISGEEQGGSAAPPRRLDFVLPRAHGALIRRRGAVSGNLRQENTA